MASKQQVQQFINDYAPYAMQAQQATGINAQLILAEWGNEVAWGTDWAEKNNIGNVGVYGGGPNPSYGTIQQGVQAYINFINSNSRYQAVKNAGVNNPQAQAVALGESGYASGGYNNGSGPGSSLIADMDEVAQNGFGSAVTQAPNPNVAGSASSSGAGTTATAAAAPAATPAATTSFSIPGYGTVQATGQQASALSTIEATLQAYGFTSSQTATLTNWAWSEITNNVDPTQIAIDLQTPGTTGYTIFEQQYPGFVSANAQLNAQGLPALSVSQYASYQTQAQAMAQAAGLPPGFINKTNIGILVGNNVSTSELSSRLNDATTLAINSTPEQRTMFNQYFGTADDNPQLGIYNPPGGSLTTGQIAALALDPNVAEPLIHQQIQAAQLGGAGVTAGIGSISEQEAMQIAQSFGGSLTQSQINTAVGNVAPYAPLETARPGMGGEAAQGVINPDQLIGTQLLPTAANTRQLQTAEEVAKAPFSGGGGYVSNTKGTGVGSAGSQGAGQ